jgi:hypothetical protein
LAVAFVGLAAGVAGGFDWTGQGIDDRMLPLAFDRVIRRTALLHAFSPSLSNSLGQIVGLFHPDLESKILGLMPNHKEKHGQKAVCR